MSKLRIVLDTDGGKLGRLRVKENNEEGAYYPLKRPIRQEDLVNFRTIERAARLLARGVLDEGDITEAVNAPRPPRRPPPKRPLASEGAGAPEKSRPRRRPPGRPGGRRRRR
jgi:hypothetical protein